MRVLIIGCGRSGTNLLYQAVRLSGYFTPSNNIEDRDIFNFRELPDRYMTKIAIERLSDQSLLDRYMDKYPDLRLVFSIRHPYDVLASKIHRGRPRGLGGDNMSEEYMSDSDPAVACNLIRLNWNLWQILSTNYPDRVYIVKMENLLLNTEGCIMELCKFLKVSSRPAMFTPWRYNTNKYHLERYKNRKADQVDLWADRRSWGGAFNAFDFTKYNHFFLDLAKYFNYKLIGIVWD